MSQAVQVDDSFHLIKLEERIMPRAAKSRSNGITTSSECGSSRTNRCAPATALDTAIIPAPEARDPRAPRPPE